MRAGALQLAVLVIFAARMPLTGQQVASVVDTKGKYPVVHVTGEPPKWRLDSVAVLRDADGLGYKEIYAALIDPRGGVLVAESAPAIHRFDDRGHEVGVIGRAGAGPNEYRLPASLGWFGDDLAIYDPGNGRLVRASRTGQWLAQWRPEQLASSLRLHSIEPGRVWLEDYGKDPQGQRSHNLVHYSAAGPQDTLWLPYRAPIRPGDPSVQAPHTVACEWSKGADDFGSPFFGAISANRPIAPGLRASISSGAYRIALLNGHGDTVKVLEHVVPPVRISDAEWADSNREYHDFVKAHPEAHCHGSIDRPPFKPSITALASDDHGRLWVERQFAEGARWEIWEGNTLVGSVASPPRYYWRPIDIRAGRMAVIRESAEGGAEVAVYRISPPG